MGFNENLSSFKKGRKRPLSFMGFFVDLRTRTHRYKFGLEPILRSIIRLRRLSSQRPIIDIFLLSLQILQPSCLLCSFMLSHHHSYSVLKFSNISRFVSCSSSTNEIPINSYFSFLVYYLVEKKSRNGMGGSKHWKNLYIMLENISNAASCCFV